MLCQLIPQGFRQREVLHVSCSNKQRRDVLLLEACYPATCQQGLVCGLLVGNDSAKVMFFHENTKKSPVADYF